MVPDRKDAEVFLKKGGGRLFKAGGAWIFDNEIDRTEGMFTDGDILAVRDFDGYFLGTGYINRHSKITVRMLTRHEDCEDLRSLLRKRVSDAWEYRKRVIDTGSCRLIFGEADFLPGITVDKYEDILVVESLTLGIDRLKLLILDLLKETLLQDGIRIRGIYERSDAKVRELEGLPRTTGFLGDPFDPKVQIRENGILYRVDVENGQKTGFFLDQKLNRMSIRPFCRGARVLDCFTHTGSFALNAAAAGASEVLAVDQSALAIAQAGENASLNGMDSVISFRQADVFQLLPVLKQEGESFDVVILDPPAFTKSRNSLKNAVKGYRELNRLGMELVKDGGFFVTCSCSHFLSQELFRKTIGEAALSARIRLRQVEFRTQSPDHPILWAADESWYLKFFSFQIRRGC